MGSQLSPGTNLGRYEIRSQLGAGGMGEVYLAQDTQLDRTVALKILPANVAADRQRMQRFIQEAKAASGLNHPNILTIHGIEQINSVLLIATEFIDGETLRQHMNVRRMKIAEALDISAQIASALAAAHTAGIIHRDIKPENIMLRHDGIVKVLDFGLAKLSERVDPAQEVDAEAATKVLVQTEPGVVMGTAAYMSPEQARGKNVDARTDIFSLGAVIYEMLSGRAPFAGETAADIIGALIHKEPQPLSTLVPNIPVELQHTVSKALRKDRDERYQTVKSLLADLKTLKQELDFAAKLERSVWPASKDAASKNNAQAVGANAAMNNGNAQAAVARPTSSAESIVSRIKQHRHRFVGGLLVLLLASIGYGYWVYRGHESSVAPIESIAVLPFVNESGNSDVEYLSDGMTESLINSLSQLPKLSVKARSSVFRYKGKDIEPQQVGSELSVQAILNGRVVQHGDQLILSLELVDTQTGNQIWGQQYNQKLSDILAIEDEIVRRISEQLRIKLSGEAQKQLTKRYTDNTEAYQAYLKGRYYANKFTEDGLKRAIEHFNQAIEIDPNYALAYAGLSSAYWNDNDLHMPPWEAMPKAKAAAIKALAIDEKLAEAHAALAIALTAYDWDWLNAEKEIRRAIELNPDYATAHLYYGWLLSVVGRFDESVAELRRAQQLDPLSLEAGTFLGLSFLRAHQYDQAIEQLQKALDMDPTFWLARLYLAWTYEAKGQLPEAIAELQRARQLNDSHFILGSLGQAYALSGKTDEAKKILKELLTDSKRRYVSSHSIAIIYAGLGEKNTAFEWLEKAYEQRSEVMSSLKFDTRLDSLHSDPHFAELTRRVGLPQ
jgi:serine/threonine protein kinase/Tfp pilus assembly protein PilF